ncbi:hypothetical protein LINPERPRIM_LOCUS19079 [Linum perenne]
MRIGQIKIELHRGAIERRVQFSLEEINADGDVEGVSTSCTGTGVGSQSSGIPTLPWIDHGEDNSPIGVTASDVVPNKEGQDTDSHLAVNGITMEADEDNVAVNDTTVPEVNDSQVPHLPTVVEVNDSQVPHLPTDMEVNDSQVPHLPTDMEVKDSQVPHLPTDMEVNLGGVPQVRTWLGVDEVIAEMEREEALNEPLQDLDEYWSSPTIPSSPDTPGEFWDGRYNPYSSEEDTDPAYTTFLSSPSSPDYAPSDYRNPSSQSDSDSEVRGQDVHSQAGSNGELQLMLGTRTASAMKKRCWENADGVRGG